MVGPTYYLHPGDLSLIKLVMPRLAPTDPKFHTIPKSQICAYSTAEFQFLSLPRDRGRQPEFCSTSQYPWYSLQSTTGPDKTFQSLTQAPKTDRDHVSDLARLESLMAGWSWDCPEAMGEPSRPQRLRHGAPTNQWTTLVTTLSWFMTIWRWLQKVWSHLTRRKVTAAAVVQTSPLLLLWDLSADT